MRSQAALSRGRRTVVVFGDMLELGENAPASHLRIGHLMASLRVGSLIAFGREASHAARAAREAGMDPAAVFEDTDMDRVREAVRRRISAGDVVLVKGSRGMRLEVVASDIREEWA